jgi:hypothetical protein
LGDIGKTGTDLTKDLENLKLDLPKTDPPPDAAGGGRPVGAPPPKPLEAPGEPTPRPPESAPPGTPTPLSPTAPGRPEAPVGPHEPAPAPAGGPREPVSAPATTGERLPSAIPQPAEPTPARVPVSPGGSAVEPAPAAAHSLQPAPALTSAPSASAPHFTSPASRPPELPAPGGGWHGPGDGGPPGGHPHGGPPHHGGPHGHGDGGASHGSRADGGDYRTAIHSLTSDDLLALADYTGSGYQDLNSALRSDALDASQHARVDALNNALEKLPAYDGLVIRGTNLPPEVLAQYRPGEVITEDAFLSTTTNPAVARSPSFAGNVEFRIMSSTGRDISSISMFPGEQEILFPAGSKFLVVSKIVDTLTGRTVIRMIER